MDVIDLCCGAGGFSLGFKQAGFNIVLGVDIWKPAVETFKRNIGNAVQMDIRDLKDLPSCDVLIGSPPCQHFSVANQYEHDEDPSLLYEFLCVVERIKPKYWVMEEVPMVEQFLPSGTMHTILCANRFGLEHRRERLFAGSFPIPNSPRITETRIPTPTATEWKGCSSKKNREKMNRFSDYLGRKATVEECRDAMGFPPDYVFTGTKKDQYILVGNAVCPPVSFAIAESIKANRKTRLDDW